MDKNTALEVQLIPLNQIQPNPNNPRPFITDNMVDEMAASIQEVDLLNPIKLVKSDLLPDGLGHPEYTIISGHIRYLAFKKIAKDTIPAQVLDLSPEMAFITAYLDNRGQKMPWIADYLSAEKLQKINPDLSVRDIAGKLGISKTKIAEMFQILRVLNPASRGMIFKTLQTVRDADSLGDSWKLYEGAVTCLAGIEDPSKSPEENQSLVERALKVVIDKQMNETKAKNLVVWVKAGNPPESYPDSGNGAKVEKFKGEKGQSINPDDPNSGYWDALPEFVKVTLGKKGYEIRMTVPPSMAITAAYGAMSNMEYVKGLAQEPEDNKFRQALPEVTQAAAKALLAERQTEAQMQSAAHSRQLAVKAQKEEAKAERRAAVRSRQLAVKARKEEETAKKAEARRAEAHTNLENHKAVLRQKAETLFGTSPLTDRLVQKCHEGNKAEALKTAKFYLDESGRSPQEQASALEDFKKDLNEHGRLMRKAGVAPAMKKKEPIGEKALNGTGSTGSPQAGVASSSTPAYSAGTPRNDSDSKTSGGLLDKLAKAVEEKTGLTPQDLKEGVETMLAKDAKQAVNYQIRRGMRNILKDLFKKIST